MHLIAVVLLPSTSGDPVVLFAQQCKFQTSNITKLVKSVYFIWNTQLYKLLSPAVSSTVLHNVH